MRLLIGWIKALRPKQWTKNALVFAALIFAHRFTDPGSARQALVAFALFCALSSSMYLLNDVMDLAEDRQHPRKRYRPLAAGVVPVWLAVVSALVLGGGAVVGLFALNAPSGWLGVSYVLLQGLYNLWLKHTVILDVFCIAAGFVLRAVVGATALDVVISPWLLICTTLLALFLALTKRRQELVSLGDRAAETRPILGEYSQHLLDQMINVVTASTVMSYALYTISERTVRELGTDKLMYTLPFVLYGIFRYQYLVHQKDQGEAPDRVLLNDGPLLLDVVLYAAAVLFILLCYGRPG